MPSRKEAQRSCGAHRRARRHLIPERANTARPDEKHVNFTLQQVNAPDDFPASNAECSFAESPTVRRLPHEIYELSERPAGDQPQMPFFQRPKSSGSLSEGECCTFEIRQSRDITFRREVKLPLQQESLSQRSSQRSQSTEDANEQPGAASLDEEHSTASTEPSRSGKTNSVGVDTTFQADLTRGSTPSAAIQTVQPSNIAEDTKSIQQSLCQEQSGNVTSEPPSEYLVTSAVDRSDVHHAEIVSVEGKSHSPFDMEPLANSKTMQSLNPSHQVSDAINLVNASRIVSEPICKSIAHPQAKPPLVTINEIQISQKKRQYPSGHAHRPSTGLESTQQTQHGSESIFEPPTAPYPELTNGWETSLRNSMQGENKDVTTEETRAAHHAHALQANTGRLAEKPAKVCKIYPGSRLVLQPSVPSFQSATELRSVTAASSGHVVAPRDTAPSEEDLCYLLMYKQRQQKDFEKRLVVRQKQLETVNERLTQQNRDYQRQLRASRCSRDKSVADAKLQKSALEEFKTRFQKLKVFVNGLGSDYGALRQQADEMRCCQQGLLTDKDDIFRELHTCRTASQAAERSMSAIVASVGKIRQDTLPLEQSSSDVEKRHDSETQLFPQEQEMNKKLETHLLSIENGQDKYRSAIQDEQRAILNQLKDVSMKIDGIEKATVVESQPLQLTSLDECVKMLTTLRDTDRVGPADFAKVTEAVSSLAQSLSSCQKCSDEGFQAAAGMQVDFSNELVAQITTLFELIRASTVQETHLAGLREDKVRLEEQLKSSENVMREIREGRASADARESHLRNTTDSLLNQMKMLQSKLIPTYKHSPQMDERDMIGTWRLKYASISQELKTSEERAGMREKEILESKDEIRQLTEQVASTNAERNEAAQALREASDRHLAQEGEISKLQQKLADRESTIGGLRLEIQPAGARIQEEKEKVEELARSRTRHQIELKEMKSQLESATTENAKATQQFRNLEQSHTAFADVQTEAVKVVQLTEELHKEHTKVTKLGQEIEPLEHIARQVPGLRRQLMDNRKAIESLESRPEGAEGASREAGAIKQNVLKSAEAMSILQGELQEAQKNASWGGLQKEGCRKATQEAEGLRKKLVYLRALADRVPGLEKEIQDHSEEVLRLQQELVAAKESSKELQGVQATNRHSSEETTFLANKRLSYLTSLEDAINHEDQEARILSERLKASEDSLRNFQALNQTLRDKDEQIATLSRELDGAKESLKRLKDEQSAHCRKREEIASLREKLKALETTLSEDQTVKEESQRKQIELFALKDRLGKINEESQRLSQTLAERPSQDQDPSHDTMAALQEMITTDGRNLQTGQAVVMPALLEAVSQLTHKACHRVTFATPPLQQTRIAEAFRMESTGPSSGQVSKTAGTGDLMQMTESEVLPTQETMLVPETQPPLDSRNEEPLPNPQNFESISSPLADFSYSIDPSYKDREEWDYFSRETAADGSGVTFAKVSANFNPSPRIPLRSQREPSSSRPLSSSTGDTMLLEAEQELKRLRQRHGSLFPESSRQPLGPQSEASSPDKLYTSKSEGKLANVAGKSPSETAKARSNDEGIVTSTHLSPQRLRRESQTRTTKTMPLQEWTTSDRNVPGSPQGDALREKYLPNSAAKRRLEDDEISLLLSSQDRSKRLKRKSSVLKKTLPSNKKGSSFLEQVTPAAGICRLNHPNRSTSGRKGSITGTNASALGADQRTGKKSKKRSKTDRYSARFNPGRT